MITIGLTGGIGSGKSTVAAMLVERGAFLVDADVLAREVVEAGTAGYAAVIDRFGEAVVNDDGTLDRAALAAVVFDDAEARSDLNAIVHPEVARRMAEEVSRHTGSDDVVVLDIPLLVEGGKERYPVAGVLVVDAPLDVAVDRLVAERGMSRDEALRRIRAQAGREERIAAADFVIMNMGTIEELREMVSRAWDWITGLRQEGAGQG